MRNLMPFLLLSTLLLFISCRKDDISETDPIFTPNAPSVTVESSFFGIVKDGEDNVIPGATIITEFGDLITDANGYFILKEAPLTQDGSLVKVVKEGYFDAFRFVMPTPGNIVYVEVSMIKKESMGTFDAAAVGKINFTNSTSLTLYANTLANQDGTPYTGTYDVYAHFYNPTDVRFAEQCPGDLRGVDSSGTAVQLVSYGMIAVELVASSGEPLNLLSGTSARWEIAVDPNITSLPQEIPLWSLDEETGVWQEEGKAILENGKYLGEPTHFSFWNCDVPFPLVELSGIVLDADDLPVAKATVYVSNVDGLLGCYGTTDNQGRFRGNVPLSEDLNLNLFKGCNDPVEYEIGVLLESKDLGTLFLDQTASLSGYFLDCNGVPVQNGYVSVRLEGRLISVIPTEKNGSFHTMLSICEQGNYTFKGIDQDGLTESDEFVYTLTDLLNGIDLGEISACDSLDEYWEVTIAGETNVGTDYELEYTDRLDDLYSFSVSTPNDFSFTSWRDSLINFSVSYKANSAHCDFFDACIHQLNFDLDIIPSLTEDYCEGRITGEMAFDDGVIRQIDIDFRLKVDQRTVTLGLDNFLDENKNGLKDPGERVVTIPVQYDGQTSSAGRVTIELPLIQPMEFKYLLYPLYRMTEQDVGSDDSIDSDFNLDGTLFVPGLTESLQVDAGFIYTGLPSYVDFEVLPKYCDEGTGCVVIGLPDALNRKYELKINDAFGNVLYESGLQSGYHTTCNMEPGNYQASLKVGGITDWEEDFIIMNDEITIEQDMQLRCIGEEIEATMSVEIINQVGESIIDPFSQELRNAAGMVVQTGPEFIAGPGTYTFTALYQDCAESVEFVVPEDQFFVSGKVWDDAVGTIPNLGEQDEAGVEGIEIILKDTTTGQEQSAFTTTEGIYLFEGDEIDADEFTLRIVPPSGRSLVEKVTGSAGLLFSSADPLTAETIVITRSCLGRDVNFGIK